MGSSIIITLGTNKKIRFPHGPAVLIVPFIFIKVKLFNKKQNKKNFFLWRSAQCYNIFNLLMKMKFWTSYTEEKTSKIMELFENARRPNIYIKQVTKCH